MADSGPGRRIMEHLRRCGPGTAVEIARHFGVSPVWVRSRLSSLVRQGMVRVADIRPSRGRPARVYALTAAGRGRFPSRDGALALQILEDIEREHGREAVLGALERRSRRLREAYAAACEGGSPAARLDVLARIRDEEGYACGTVAAGGPLPDLVERHCPVEAVARRWPELCRMEAEVFTAVLGRTVTRTEHLLAGGTCCAYRVGTLV